MIHHGGDGNLLYFRTDLSVFFFQETVETVIGKVKLTKFPDDNPPCAEWGYPLDDIFNTFPRHNNSVLFHKELE